MSEVKAINSNVGSTFVKRMAIILGVLFTCVLCLAPNFVSGPVQKNSYMGAEYCGSCHQSEYQSWYSSSHRMATERLPSESKNDQFCLSCHATGVLEKNQPFFKGITCEACHGPGEYYASLHVKKDPVLSKLLFMQRPNEDSCRHCHSNNPTLWSPHHAMKKIDHWSTTTGFHGEKPSSFNVPRSPN